jgi:acyl-CoA hydrolase
VEIDRQDMTQMIAADKLDLSAYLRPGDRIVIGQACGEPGVLVEALIEQGRHIGGLSVFIGSSFSGLFTPAAAESFTLSSMGAIGSLRAMAKAGDLHVIPIHMSQIGPAIESGTLGCDVAMIQVSAADEDGNHSCGLISDHVRAAVEKARLVIAEVNAAVPFTCGETVHASEVDLVVPLDRPPIQITPAKSSDVEEAIARHCSAFISDGSVLQTGVGALPNAILNQLGDRKDLGIHSGMISDSFVDLVEAGAITNARKEIDTGVSITGALVGTRKLYDFAARNPSIRMCAASYTHNAAALAKLSRLVMINSALEVDLTGQVNAEFAGGAYVGATGGQVDFTRAGSQSLGGHSIITLSATAMAGSTSKIVSKLIGPVTTARTDVDVIVTEFGAAELKGCSLEERAKRMVAIAHPDFREKLEHSADTIAKQRF